MWEARKKHLCEYLNLSINNIDVYDHHKSHSAYGFCTSPLYKKEPLLVLQLMVEAIILTQLYLCTQKKERLRKSVSSNANIGRIYRSITLLLE